MSLIEPIGAAQQQLVIKTTRSCIVRAEKIFARPFPLPTIVFDLPGCAAGMYLLRQGQRLIRFNPYIFAKYFNDNVAVTVPHEVAHYIIDSIHGLRNVRPHGKEWRTLMKEFGARADRTCNYDLSGVPRRSYRQYPYRCECNNYMLTAIRHNKVQRKTSRYFCKNCKSELFYSASRF